MDINQNKLMNHTWDVEMSMEEKILHDPIASFNSLWPAATSYSYSYPIQTQQIPSSSTQIPSSSSQLGEELGNTTMEEDQEEPEEELGAMKEMMYTIAAMQPVDIDPTTIRKPKRRNIRISDDPQSVAARHRRERISEKIRILQRLVPGGTKMDTASMLDEAIRYVKFLKRQIRFLQSNPQQQPQPCTGDWQVMTPNQALASTSSISLDNAIGPGLSFGDHGRISNNLCFNHEVINELFCASNGD